MFYKKGRLILYSVTVIYCLFLFSKEVTKAGGTNMAKLPEKPEENTSNKKKPQIDLFRLYILFSQYKSRDNTQEDWFFVLLIKKSACKHEYVGMHSF